MPSDAKGIGLRGEFIMMQALIQTLLNNKEEGFSIKFKTDGRKYFIYIGSGLHATLNKSEFDKFFKQWKLVTAF